jgi:hypothetical protein
MELLARFNAWLDRWFREVFGFLDEEDWEFFSQDEDS